MKFTKIVALCLTASIIFVVFSGCTAATAYQKSIYDDDSKIVNQADSFSFIKRIGNTTGEELSVKFGTFYGMETLYTVESEETGTITFKYNVQIDKGKFKCVLITPDDEVINVIEQSGEGEKSIDIPEGKSRIKIIGNNAGGEIKLEVSVGDGMLLKIMD